MHRTVVIDVVGLTYPLLGPHTPNLNALAGEKAGIQPITPAVTCSVQATYLTGKLPNEHGIVANGWYFRDLNEVWLWRQSNRLVQAPKVWDLGRARDPEFTCCNSFWWYAMATRADYTLTPRPLYCADGLKLPDCYSKPLELREELTQQLGSFPLFHFWGPATSIKSSQWIADATKFAEEKYAPTLQLVYLPHLDYCLQRLGPGGDIANDVSEVDKIVGELLQYFEDRGCRVILLSEYGILPVHRPVHPNRILREAGLLSIKVDRGREYLDPGTCRALAVADHQVAHIYIENPGDIPTVRRLFEQTAGVAEVLDADGKREHRIDHKRSGELVLLAETDSWFTYYFWLDDAVAPDYARTIDIHKKPGYDPCELFIDRTIRWPKLKVASILARKSMGFRYSMDVISLDPNLVKGSHGCAIQTPETAPVLMSSRPELLSNDTIPATEVCNLILEHIFKN